MTVTCWNWKYRKKRCNEISERKTLTCIILITIPSGTALVLTAAGIRNGSVTWASTGSSETLKKRTAEAVRFLHGVLSSIPEGACACGAEGLWHPSGLWPSVPRVVEKGCIASLRGPPIGGQENDRVSNRCSAPYTLLPLRGISPQGETRNLRRKTESHILHVPLRHSPFGGWRHHLSPASGGTTTRAYCRDAYEENVSRCFILPPEQGEVRRSRKGGGERSEPTCRMLIMPYDTARSSRNADFILIAREGDTTTLGLKGRQT